MGSLFSENKGKAPKERKQKRILLDWRRKVLLLGATFSALAVAVSQASAAGLLIADGGFGGVLEVKEQEVRVVVNNRVAVTTVDQIFLNKENRQVEALYTFPVPKGASVSNFSMWIGGKEMVGEVLEKKRARQIYESYKQTRRDPGLLEQVDYKTFEMRVFPIGPKAEQHVRVTYYQELNVDHDWATYVYPLATVTRKDVDAGTSGRFAFTLEAKSAASISKVESPSHGQAFAMAQHSANYFEASLERTAGINLDKDIVLAYKLARPGSGVDLITSKEKDGEGVFSLTVTAGEDLAKLDDGMDYVFLVDISGSMGADGKLLISKESVGAFIGELSDKDRFEVLTFNVRPTTLFGGLEAATTENASKAESFLASQQARGGTVLNPALTTAYKYLDADRTLNVIVLSDGMTEQNERTALLGLIGSRPGNTRVFCIGVGNEVNRPLLEQMAEDSGGLAAFLSNGDNFTRQAKAFRRKLMHPAASGLALDFKGLDVFDLEPQKLPNLYHGSPVTVYGRYRKGGSAIVTLTGDVRGVILEKSVELEFPNEDLDNPEIDRMWAWKKVDRLLKQADRQGTRQAVIEEVVRLGEAYSIVTEYTSFIVLENDAEYKRWKIERKNVLLTARDRKAQERLRANLDKIRESAFAELGPEALKNESNFSVSSTTPNQGGATQKLASAQPSRQAPGNPSPSVSQPPRQSPRQSRDFNFGIGGGPVGPLFVAFAAWLRKRKIQLK